MKNVIISAFIAVLLMGCSVQSRYSHYLKHTRPAYLQKEFGRLNNSDGKPEIAIKVYLEAGYEQGDTYIIIREGGYLETYEGWPRCYPTNICSIEEKGDTLFCTKLISMTKMAAGKNELDFTTHSIQDSVNSKLVYLFDRRRDMLIDYTYTYYKLYKWFGHEEETSERIDDVYKRVF